MARPLSTLPVTQRAKEYEAQMQRRRARSTSPSKSVGSSRCGGTSNGNGYPRGSAESGAGTESSFSRDKAKTIANRNGGASSVSKHLHHHPQQQQQEQARRRERRSKSPAIRKQNHHRRVQSHSSTVQPMNHHKSNLSRTNSSDNLSRIDSHASLTDLTPRREAQPTPPPSSPEQQEEQEEEEEEAPAAREGGGGGGGGGGMVTPEMLVDALSGHEDGLLAIAERLMEHYEDGYDAMGEAIIDAFADVQKLFQHVVEAAHMEGAAFESSRREEEEKKRRNDPSASSNHPPPHDHHHRSANPPPPKEHSIHDDVTKHSPSGGGMTRHEEFVDQDVKDILGEAIRMGAPKKDSGKDMELYELYESACQNASALLPVDSDHRGRLQLSIARAESMSPDRACAILRYAMDDVIRCQLSASTTTPHEIQKRSDCVLKPAIMSPSSAIVPMQQTAEEVLDSLVEEMKEVLSAPVYEHSPIQPVATRFWAALGNAQKSTEKKEEKLEHSLGQLKGDFLLARAEWEEKYSNATNETEQYKRKYNELFERNQQQHQYMDCARTTNMKRMPSNEEFPSHHNHSNRGPIPHNNHHHNNNNNNNDDQSTNSSPGEGGSPGIRGIGRRATPSVASIGSGFALAKSMVGSISCGIGAADRGAGGVPPNSNFMGKQSQQNRSSPESDARSVNTKDSDGSGFGRRRLTSRFANIKKTEAGTSFLGLGNHDI